MFDMSCVGFEEREAEIEMLFGAYFYKVSGYIYSLTGPFFQTKKTIYDLHALACQGTRLNVDV